MRQQALPKVVIAEDHRLVAEGLESLLAGHCSLVASVQDVASLEKAVVEHQPDVLVLDVNLGGEDAIQAFTRMKESGCKARPVFVTMNPDPACWQRSIRAGAVGYVLKTAAAVELRAAVQAASEGRSFVSGFQPDVLEAALKAPQKTSIPMSNEHITPRQRQVLKQLARGLSAKEIAEVLGISQRTVEYHKYQMMQAVGVGSATALVLWGLKNGIVEAEK